MSALRVLHVASGDLWAGAEVMLFHLARVQAQDSEIDVKVVLMNEGRLADQLSASGVATEILPESTLSITAIFSRLTRIIREYRPDIVHTHRKKENILGAFAAKLAHCPVCIRTVHGAPERQYSLRNFGPALIEAVDKFVAVCVQSAVVFVSDALADSLRTSLRARRSYVIPNGIDMESVSMQAVGGREQGLGRGTEIHVCWVGRLESVKRVDIFLQIALHMKADIRYRFYVFGDGSGRQYCEEFVRDHGLQYSVRLMGFQPDMATEFSRMDYMLITSDSEGLPMALLEAIAAGVIVVSRNVGGISSVIMPDETGILVNESDAAGLADALRSIAEDSDKSNAIRARAAEYVRSEYSVLTTAHRYKQAYSELLRG